MSQKIEMNIVAGALKKHADQIPPDVMRAIIEDLNQEADGKDAGEPKAPAVKKQFVFVVSDPEGRLPKTDFVGWVVQIPESDSPSTVMDRIIRTAHDFNGTKRGKLMPVQTVGECIENARARQFKENGVWVKTRVPVFMARTSNNEIPDTPSLLSDADRNFHQRGAQS
jgi:hypothetical protein